MKDNSTIKVIIAAGGSGGHIFPAIALARRLRERQRNCDILFVGSNKALDRRVFEKEGFAFRLLSTNKLPYRPSLAFIPFAALLFRDLLRSVFTVLSYRPHVAVGFGGYLSSPVAIASRLFGVPVLVHEQNVVPGRANRSLFRMADVIAVSFGGTVDRLGPDAKKAVLTGNPIRPELFSHDRQRALKAFGLAEGRFTVLVIGGSQGSRRLNEVFSAAFAGLDGRIKAALQVIHITGAKDYERTLDTYKGSGVEHRVYSFIDRIEEAYSASDLAVTRSGSSALFELAFFGKPVIAVPYPFALSHQEENGRVFEKAGAALMIKERDLSDLLVKEAITGLLNDKVRLNAMGEASRRLGCPEASDVLASQVLRLAKRSRRLLEKKRIHFVGVGGIGMSGIALVLARMGYKISGSDAKLNDITKKIEEQGVKVFEGHKRSNVGPQTELVVYSSSITGDNPEFAEALDRNLFIAQRAEMLAELFNRKDGIAISGTHGKTTTTSLVSVMLEKCGLDPTAIIGGEIDLFKGNAKLGRGRYFVAEADESDASFLHLNPLHSVITNVELEHLDYYKTLDDVLSSYAAFAHNTRPGGAVYYCEADANAGNALARYAGRKESFGFSESADIHPVDLTMSEFSTAFGCVYKGRRLGRAELRIPGRHNVLNALACLLVGLNLGLGFDEAAAAIKDFTGTKRRFHLRANTGGIMLIDDYAHHPTEIRAVLDACRNWKEKRVIAIFQPHRYTRTLFMADDFGRCFAGVDKLILTDIYAASEAPIEGVSVRSIYDRVRDNGVEDVVMMNKNDIADYVMGIKKAGDMIVVLGAGDIKNVADELSDRLNGVKAA
ncbi:MAG: UDP-N-acetylmuramate--L-alanine ligase [Candidatus Omnitrophica bacterium]|nr:UDP-N-acetylmuramate--L-alanine ligase [Candidatus Omnitrophota bacterium]